MKKEVLTLSNIRQDLSRFPRFYRYYSIEWRYIFFLLITPVAVLIGMVFKSLWAGLLVFTAAAYHIVRFVMACIHCAQQTRLIENACERSELSISVQRLRRIATEKIYEPHLATGIHKIHFFKKVCFFEFDSLRWRVPDDFRHYEWSDEFCVGPGVLKNAAVPEAEFICVTVKEYPDIAYVYPCQFFTPDKSLPYAVELE